jgi:hypothetical protein
MVYTRTRLPSGHKDTKYITYKANSGGLASHQSSLPLPGTARRTKVVYHYENRIYERVTRARSRLVSLPDSHIRLEIIGKPVPLANIPFANLKETRSLQSDCILTIVGSSSYNRLRWSCTGPLLLSCHVMTMTRACISHWPHILLHIQTVGPGVRVCRNSTEANLLRKRRQWSVGGGDVGVVGRISEGAKEAPGRVTGIIHQFRVRRGTRDAR